MSMEEFQEIEIETAMMLGLKSNSSKDSNRNTQMLEGLLVFY